MEQCKWIFSLKACGVLSCSTFLNDKVLPRLTKKKKKAQVGWDLNSISLESRFQKQLTLEYIIKIKTINVIYEAATVPDTLLLLYHLI